MARRRSAHKTGPAPKKAKVKAKSALKEIVKKVIGEKQEICDKEGCKRPAVECEGHVDCDPCEDK